jgi:hypothetical protein
MSLRSPDPARCHAARVCPSVRADARPSASHPISNHVVRMRIAASRANGARSRGPKTAEGKARSAQNGALSRGPKTPEGKARSAQNATTHGLTAKRPVLPNENPVEFEALSHAYTNRLRPANATERDLVHEMAAARWRLLRATAIERDVLAAKRRGAPHLRQPTASPGPPRPHPLPLSPPLNLPAQTQPGTKRTEASPSRGPYSSRRTKRTEPSRRGKCRRAKRTEPDTAPIRL